MTAISLRDQLMSLEGKLARIKLKDGAYEGLLTYNITSDNWTVRVFSKKGKGISDNAKTFQVEDVVNVSARPRKKPL